MKGGRDGRREIPVKSSARILKNPILGPPLSNGAVLAPGDNHKAVKGRTVVRHDRDKTGQTDAHLAVNMRVRVYPGTDAESPGVIVEDFGELAGQAVDIGGRHVEPARRWAVVLDTGNLVFTNTDQLVPE